MYAVIKTGGRQFRVVAGEKIKIEQIAADVGQEVVIDQVLAVGNGSELMLGTPLVSGATVTATLLSHGLFDKVHIFKMRRRKHYQKRQGHRQGYTELFIAAITDGKGGVSKAATAAVIPAPKALAATSKGGKDNLEVIEGIGPKIAKVLVEGGIATFAQLAAAKADDITAMLKASGGRFSLANPASWAEQAALLRDGKMAEFKALTDALVGGVKK
ncbi:MAG: 50S ribosomal protein L21 [Polaromonas sp.]|nr:50S ribosomal protein L21 [Polaromonas sp.]